eukprot:2553829-Rhodomonas_salina.1
MRVGRYGGGGTSFEMRDTNRGGFTTCARGSHAQERSPGTKLCRNRAVPGCNRHAICLARAHPPPHHVTLTPSHPHPSSPALSALEAHRVQTHASVSVL